MNKFFSSSTPAATSVRSFSELGLHIRLREGSVTSLESYASQLVEEGYASARGEDVLVLWPRLYDLMADAEHQGSISLLELPELSTLQPRISSAGTPSESGFRIRLEGWRSETGDLSPSAVQRVGGLLREESTQTLMPGSAYQLLAHITELHANGVEWTGEQRMVAVGRIQKLGLSARAVLDSYLSKTPVVIAEKIDLELKTTRSAGVDVIEIVPHPVGAPPEWLDQFENFARARRRYDLVQPDGKLTHVLLPEDAELVLDPIRRLPARRVASEDADAFLHNPYSFFGDGAEKVLLPEAVERAKRDAGVIERELDITPAQSGWDVLLLDAGGEADDLFEALTAIDEARALLALAASAKQRGRPVIRWRGHRVSLGGVSLQSLSRLQQWTAETTVRDFALRLGEVFDLQAYSDRVVGFDGKPIRVPFIGREGASQEWVPENVGLTIGQYDPVTGDVSTSHLDPGQVSELKKNVAHAKQVGERTVAVPGTSVSVPVSEADAWLSEMKEVLSKQSKVPLSPKDPKDRRETPSLKILHNIEQLDYGRQATIPAIEVAAPVRPAALRAEVRLFPHQMDGLSWLQQRLDQRNDGVSGVLLADDMGLGKTLQCLALVASYREHTANPKPCLVVAPVSLLENWKKEIKTFLDGSQGETIALYGDELSRHRLSISDIEPDLRQLGLKKFLRPGFACDAAIVLTTYETLRDYEFSLAREAWGILVCDEAQKIKTPAALVTRAAKAMQADFKIACTGTPVENTLADLWCLFDFFQPALLGSLSEFTKQFRKTIELREPGHEALVETLRTAIDPWVLRRLKSDVAQLPPKIDDRHPDADKKSMSLPMSTMQMRLYDAAISGFKAALESPDEEKKPAAALALLHRLRMICANPLGVSDPKAELLPVEEHIKHSPKLSWLLEQLAEVRARGDKAIVFTEYRELQRIVQRAVAGRFDIHVDIVNGSTSVDPDVEVSRQALIDRFQARDGFGVIVLSTTAVGFGVNVQRANHVIHFTRPWNPAKEDQATDRAYRIGQDKPVWVYCPTVAGQGFESFEQRVAERLGRKRTLSQDMLAPEQSLSLSDFEGLQAAST